MIFWSLLLRYWYNFGVNSRLSTVYINLTILQWLITRKILESNVNKQDTETFHSNTYYVITWYVILNWVSSEYRWPELNTGQQRIRIFVVISYKFLLIFIKIISGGFIYLPYRARRPILAQILGYNNMGNKSQPNAMKTTTIPFSLYFFNYFFHYENI